VATNSTVLALNALAIIADSLPNINPPVPIYAILQSDTFLPLTVPSSWGEFSAKSESALSDYPQERGAFQPYNKVKRPKVVTVSLTKTGSDLARFAWLAAIEQQEAQFPTQLYTLISPDGVYVDYTIQALGYTKRPDRGSNILYLEIVFTQIPAIEVAVTSDTVAPKSGPVQQIGQLFTRATTAAETALVDVGNFITS
jgi:hypothetical protein